MTQNRKYTVITGASSGIGYEAAKAFSNIGKNVIIVARRSEKLLKLKEEIVAQNPTINVITKSVDLSKSEASLELYRELKNYEIETWINNAGFGFDGLLIDQSLENISEMIHLNVETLALLSTLYAKDYKDVSGAQLVNIASIVGYELIPKTVSYAATKFFVTAFTEGLDQELKFNNYKLRAKILAPAATKSEFSGIARNSEEFNYEQNFERYHTAAEMAEFLLQLYNSDKTVGIVNSETYQFELNDNLHKFTTQKDQ